MAKVMINPKQQLERVAALHFRLDQFNTFTHEAWIKNANPKSWCALEVAKHISIAQIAYREKMSLAFQQLKAAPQPISEIESTAIPSFLIKRFPPQAGVIRMKMKTTKRFEPLLKPEDRLEIEREAIVSELNACLHELEQWINLYPNKAVKSYRFNSAVGALVRFNVAEACEFMLCHAERHFLQLERALNQA